MKITHDLHVHTNLSLCAKPEADLKGYLDYAKWAGLKTLAVTNHFWDSAVPGAIDWYKKQDFKHISELKNEMRQIADPEIRILFGAETEYCFQEHRIAITEESAAQLDVLLVPNSHTHITMPKPFYSDFRRHADFMIQAYHDILNDANSKYITAMAHPFAAVCCPYNNELLLHFISDSQFKECFDETAGKNIAVEINASCFSRQTPSQLRNSEFMRMFQIARDCGCRFSFGSDAHAHNEMRFIQTCSVIADILELNDKQVLAI